MSWRPSHRRKDRHHLHRRQVEQAALFYSFFLEDHVPPDHMLRAIDRFVALGDLRARVRNGPRRHRLEAHRLALRERPDARMPEDQEPEFERQ